MPKYNMNYNPSLLNITNEEWSSINESKINRCVRKIGYNSTIYDPQFYKDFEDLFSKKPVIMYDESGFWGISPLNKNVNENVLADLACNRSFKYINPIKLEQFNFEEKFEEIEI